MKTKQVISTLAALASIGAEAAGTGWFGRIDPDIEFKFNLHIDPNSEYT